MSSIYLHYQNICATIDTKRGQMPTAVNTAKLLQLIEAKFGSQAAFARACGVSRQYIAQIIIGEFSPTLERTVQFADLLEVSLDEFVIRGTRGSYDEASSDLRTGIIGKAS